MISLYKNDKKLTTANIYIYIYICIYIVMTKGMINVVVLE